MTSTSFSCVYLSLSVFFFFFFFLVPVVVCFGVFPKRDLQMTEFDTRILEELHEEDGHKQIVRVDAPDNPPLWIEFQRVLGVDGLVKVSHIKGRCCDEGRCSLYHDKMRNGIACVEHPSFLYALI